MIVIIRPSCVFLIWVMLLLAIVLSNISLNLSVEVLLDSPLLIWFLDRKSDVSLLAHHGWLLVSCCWWWWWWRLGNWFWGLHRDWGRFLVVWWSRFYIKIVNDSYLSFSVFQLLGNVKQGMVFRLVLPPICGKPCNSSVRVDPLTTPPSTNTETSQITPKY